MKKLIFLWAMLSAFGVTINAQPSLSKKDLSTSPAIAGFVMHEEVGVRNLMQDAGLTITGDYTVEIKAKFLSDALKGFFLETRNAERKGFRLAIQSNGISNYSALNYTNNVSPVVVDGGANPTDIFYVYRFAVEGDNVHVYRNGYFLATTALQNIFNDNYMKDANGDFESEDMSMWEFIRAGQGRTTTEGEFRNGLAAVKLNNGNNTDTITKLTVKGLKPSTTYSMSFYAKYLSKTTTNGNMRYDFRLGYYDASDNFIRTNAEDKWNNVVGSPTNTTVPASAVWTSNTKQFTTGAQDSIAILNFIGWNGNNTYVLDDFSISEAESIPVVGSAIGSNLVTNGDFATDATGWSNGSWPLGSVAWSATNGGQLQIKETTWVNSSNATYSKSIAVTPGKTYKLSAKTSQRLSAASPFFRSVRLVDGGFSVSADYSVPSGSLTTYYENTTPAITAGLESTSLSMQFTTKTNSNTGSPVVVMTLDDVVLQEYEATFPTYLKYGKAYQSESLGVDVEYINYDLTGAYAPQNIYLSSGITNSSSITCTTCDVTVAAGAELNVDGNTLYPVNVAAGGKLTFSGGVLRTTNGITLESTTDGTATLVDEYNSPTVSATVKQHVTAGRNWYVSSPLSAAGFGALNRGTSVVEWNEATKVWDTKSSGTLTPGKGYIQVATSSPSVTGTTGTVDFTGTTNSGNVTVTLSRTESGSKRGFNLVGNPYPSYLKWSGENGVITDAGNNGIGTSFWYRTKNNANAYIFVTHNGTTGYTIPADQTPNSAITGKIPPMQAFWVLVNHNVNTEDPIYPNNSVTLTFKNNMREHGIGDGNKLKAPKNDDRKRLRLQLSNGAATDETLIFFDTQAVNIFDKYDSPKMMNNSEFMPDLYTKAGTEKVGINGLTSLTENMELPLGFNLLSSANLKLKTTEMANFGSSTKVYLLDKTNNSQTELQAETEYNFSTTESTTNNESRFSLLFRAPGVTTNVDNTTKLNAQVFVNAYNQITIIAPDKCTYAIYNAVGQMISKGVTRDNTTLVDVKSVNGGNNAHGFYVVNVSDTEKAVTTKVIIK